MDIIFDISVIIGLTVGVVAVIKRIGLPVRFAPLVALAIGIGLSFLAITDQPIKDVILTGILCGLSASGLYDLGKTTALGK